MIQNLCVKSVVTLQLIFLKSKVGIALEFSSSSAAYPVNPCIQTVSDPIDLWPASIGKL